MGFSVHSPRGDNVEEWAASLDLNILNRGSAPTCIRAQSTSIVDLSWGSADIVPKVIGWRVASMTETLSDHALIVMDVEWRGIRVRYGGKPGEAFPRWSLRSMDHDLLIAAMVLLDWFCPQPLNCEADVAADRLQELLTSACDVAAPRCKRRSNKRQMYWWNNDLAELRRVCTKYRRRSMVKFRRRKNIVEAELARMALRNTQRQLRTAIAKAKAAAWKELLTTLERDPWGRPYKIVMQRLKSSVAATEKLDPPTLTRIIQGLFPEDEHAKLVNFSKTQKLERRPW